MYKKSLLVTLAALMAAALVFSGCDTGSSESGSSDGGGGVDLAEGAVTLTARYLTDIGGREASNLVYLSDVDEDEVYEARVPFTTYELELKAGDTRIAYWNGETDGWRDGTATLTSLIDEEAPTLVVLTRAPSTDGYALASLKGADGFEIPEATYDSASGAWRIKGPAPEYDEETGELIEPDGDAIDHVTVRPVLAEGDAQKGAAIYIPGLEEPVRWANGDAPITVPVDGSVTNFVTVQVVARNGLLREYRVRVVPPAATRYKVDFPGLDTYVGLNSGDYNYFEGETVVVNVSRIKDYSAEWTTQRFNVLTVDAGEEEGEIDYETLYEGPEYASYAFAMPPARVTLKAEFVDVYRVTPQANREVVPPTEESLGVYTPYDGTLAGLSGAIELYNEWYAAGDTVPFRVTQDPTYYSYGYIWVAGVDTEPLEIEVDEEEGTAEFDIPEELPAGARIYLNVAYKISDSFPSGGIAALVQPKEKIIWLEGHTSGADTATIYSPAAVNNVKSGQVVFVIDDVSNKFFNVEWYVVDKNTGRALRNPATGINQNKVITVDTTKVTNFTLTVTARTTSDLYSTSYNFTVSN